MIEIVILGNSVGGLAAALKLKKKLPEKSRVTLIEKKDPQYFYPSLLWVMTGKRNLNNIFRRLSFLHKEGINYINEQAVEILPERKKIRLKNSGELKYDLLLIATGAEYDEDIFPELKSAGYHLYELNDAVYLYQKLNTFKGGEIAFLISSLPIKCPPAVYEAALLVNNLLKKREPHLKFKITIYTPERKSLDLLGLEMSQLINKELEQQGIKVICNCKFTGIAESNKQLRFEGFNSSYDLLIYVAPHRGAEVIRRSSLGDSDGWLSADPHYLTTAYEDVFVSGDAALIKTPSGRDLLKAGVVTTFQLPAISENINALARGKSPSNSYKGNVGCLIETGNGKTYAGIGNLYHQEKPWFRILPASKCFKPGKSFVEYKWRKQGKPL
ncbi:MAG TPA: FAD/NAD(P)-binding oxidoreductase [Halanaerobiales bacterium]|nr:FAD/NAD(P)-binding oxidoreductase [Halanaerobiales bacterium]